MKLLPLLAGLVILTSLSNAQTITWGNTPGDLLLDSKDEKLTGDWKFELGVFLPGFYPTTSNIAEWVPNWVPLDTAKYNEKIGYFSSRAPAPEASAGGLQAYIWVFNARKYNPESEWLLLTDRDGNHSNDWMIPNRSADPAAAIVDWRVARATTVLMGNSPRLTASTKPKGKVKARPRVSYNTLPIPEAALLAANKPKTTKEADTALAGDIAEDFVED